jgi:hypothetical protein
MHHGQTDIGSRLEHGSIHRLAEADADARAGVDVRRALADCSSIPHAVRARCCEPSTPVAALHQPVAAMSGSAFDRG